MSSNSRRWEVGKLGKKRKKHSSFSCGPKDSDAQNFGLSENATSKKLIGKNSAPNELTPTFYELSKWIGLIIASEKNVLTDGELWMHEKGRTTLRSSGSKKLCSQRNLILCSVMREDIQDLWIGCTVCMRSSMKLKYHYS